MHSLQKIEKSSYHQKDRLEAESYDEVHSILSGEIGRQDGVENLIDKLIHRDNLNLAYQKVVRSKGAAGIDGMTVDELLPYLRDHRESILEQLRTGQYKLQPVKRVLIPKADGGKRQLGIPCVLDRLIQQAIAQILEPIFDPLFSDNSYGFRPKRNAQQAIRKAKSFYEAGYKYVVDIDMKQYFDTVHHDKLMGFIEVHIQDKQLLSLIRRILESGVMVGMERQETEKGTPQGGNLSPLLSNIYLHAFDQELQRRGHLFVGYADDCNIYVRSKRAGERVMVSCTTFLEKELYLTVNLEKSQVGSPTKRKFLGFCLLPTANSVKLRPHYQAKKRFKEKLKRITKRNRGRSVEVIFQELDRVTRGWINYYGIASMKVFLSEINGWLRRRIRQYIWKQWKRVRTRFSRLRQLGTDKHQAWQWANTRKGYWRIASSGILHRTLTDKYLVSIGYKDISKRYEALHSSY